jgi:hypothetical protein
MMEIIVKISAIQQLTFSRFRDLLTVPGAVATGRLSKNSLRRRPVATAPGTVPLLPGLF